MISTPSAARFAGLDGLRAIAVSLVVVYHLFPAVPLRGGFVGVDVFFVISGFLITSLLLRPAPAGQRMPRRLFEFWRRRARRLLPALAVVVAVCASLAWLVGGDVLVGMGRQVLGAATFSYNWLAVAVGTDYFAATTPEVFRNVWSLAVEEQFYLLWPLLLPLVLLLPRRWMRVTLALVGAAASAVWMAVLVSGGEVTRGYFGTDSHAFGLLLGIALAFAVDRMPEREWMRSRTGRLLAGVMGVAGLAAIGVAALVPERPDPTTFPGMLLLAGLGTAAVIAASSVPGSLLGRVLDIAPMRWIGDRSYGIYLWHWPLFVLALAATRGAGLGAEVPVVTGLVVLALTLVVSAASFRFIEQPIRRLGFRGALRAAGRRLTGPPARRVVALGVAGLAVVAVAGTAAAVIAAPTQSSAEQSIIAGEAAVQEQKKTPSPTPTPAPTPTAAPTPESRAIPGDEITAIGDSVMLASAPSLYEAFPGIEVDAEVSRSVWVGPEMMRRLDEAGRLRPYVVVALGTNGPVNADVLQQMADIAGPTRQLILVNAYAPRDWIPGVNADLDAFASGHRQVTVADWSGAISEHTDLLAGDQIHPGSSGGDVFAQSIHDALDQAQRQWESDHQHRGRGGMPEDAEPVDGE